jgi:hypothetical protein
MTQTSQLAEAVENAEVDKQGRADGLRGLWNQSYNLESQDHCLLHNCQKNGRAINYFCAPSEYYRG